MFVFTNLWNIRGRQYGNLCAVKTSIWFCENKLLLNYPAVLTVLLVIGTPSDSEAMGLLIILWL